MHKYLFFLCLSILLFQKSFSQKVERKGEQVSTKPNRITYKARTNAPVGMGFQR